MTAFFRTAFTVAVVSLATALVEAQSQRPQDTKGRSATQTRSGAAATPSELPASAIHVTGCVARAADVVKPEQPQGAGAPVRPDRDQYVLIGATAPAAAASNNARSKTGTPVGTTGAAAMGAFQGAYGLSGDREPELEQYLGRRIEVVGQLEPNQQGASPSASAAAPVAKALPVVTIASFKQVAGDCK